ncbi:MAG TPA: hypothetical protein VFI47_29005 [Acidimicrobiales bacterium]|nr:hypothetical protein [Acidimicrobiales bacterium]
MADNWHTGNANTDGAPAEAGSSATSSRTPTTSAATNDVEIKWGVHPAGEERDAWVTDDHRTTVIVQGRFRLNLPAESFLLENEGDYVMWGAGIDHSWRAEADSVVITVRWPSRTM